jgi:hypothetical protein
MKFVTDLFPKLPKIFTDRFTSCGSTGNVEEKLFDPLTSALMSGGLLVSSTSCLYCSLYEIG